MALSTIASGRTTSIDSLRDRQLIALRGSNLRARGVRSALELRRDVQKEACGRLPRAIRVSEIRPTWLMRLRDCGLCMPQCRPGGRLFRTCPASMRPIRTCAKRSFRSRARSIGDRLSQSKGTQSRALDASKEATIAITFLITIAVSNW